MTVYLRCVARACLSLGTFIENCWGCVLSRFSHVEFPYGAYWSTPFAKWQGALQHLHAGKFAAHVVGAELDKRKNGADIFDYGRWDRP
jgi:hypothetical protein